jgi:membrane-bound metal-dependent hydrolase YbcI (DUF457 family)
MPTPVAHSLAGLAVHFISPALRGRQRWLAGMVVVALANLPDIDFIPGYLVGEPRAYHWGPTHSLLAALMAGVMAGTIARRHKQRFTPWFAVAATAYASHVLLDLLLGPGAPQSVGLQVLWPFSAERFMAPVSLFRMFPASIQQVGPVAALFSRSVLPLIRHELLVMVPVCLMFWTLGRLNGSADEPRSPAGQI